MTTNICIGDISLHRINRLPYYQDQGSAVKVNQLGYLPNGPKYANLVSQTKNPVNWTLLNSDNAIVASGYTVPFGNDTSSGLNVHTIDFSSYSQEGTGYKVVTGTGSVSYPFTISSTLYKALRQDAMQFFYQQRSGIAIDAELAGTQYARPAGHLNVFPNTVSTSATSNHEDSTKLTRVISLYLVNILMSQTGLMASRGPATTLLTCRKDGTMLATR